MQINYQIKYYPEIKIHCVLQYFKVLQLIIVEYFIALLQSKILQDVHTLHGHI